MALVDFLWLWVLTKNEDDAGSGSKFNLTINIDGEDVLDRDCYFGINGIGDGQAGLDSGHFKNFSKLILSTPIDSNALTNSSIRLGIREDDAWGPEDALLLGRTERRIIALAMETDQQHWLSTDSSEGHLTMPLRLVGPGSSSTVIRRVLLLAYTYGGIDVETDSPIQLEITAGGSVVLQQQIPDTPQDDLEQYTANWYFLDVSVPFTRSDVLSNGGIRLSILGTDAWVPDMLFVYGLDTANGRPNEVVDLVSIPEWQLGTLSADPQEGKQSIDLPVI
jgi:hypothetical protein